MIPAAFDYLRAHTTDEAFAHLQQHGAEARVRARALAGRVLSLRCDFDSRVQQSSSTSTRCRICVRSDSRCDAESLARLRGFQSNVLSAVHPGLLRHAAALPYLSTRVSSAERDVVGRPFDPGGWLFVSVDLFDLVAALRKVCTAESLAGDRPGVANHVATADAQFPEAADSADEAYAYDKLPPQSGELALTPKVALDRS